jgi:hypothetical protein
MRPAAAPRTVQDVRTARSLPARATAGSEHDAYARLSQLARERRRLLEEQALWQRKLERITRRLAEIGAQTERLNRQPPPAGHDQAPRPGGAPWQEIEFPY